MHYVLEANNELRVARHLEYLADDGWGLDFLKGQAIDPPKQGDALHLSIESHTIDLPDYFEADGVPIVNTKLINAFQTAGVNNYQYFPLVINFKDSKVMGYSVLNVVSRINAIDKDASKYSLFGRSIARIFSLKLNEESVAGASLFREHNYQELIFICEPLKKAIEAENISGCEIYNADEWSDAHRF